jgi:hypothetical protein
LTQFHFCMDYTHNATLLRCGPFLFGHGCCCGDYVKCRVKEFVALDETGSSKAQVT